MATVEECEVALRGLAARLAGVDDSTRRKHVVDRALSCTVSDLSVVFYGRLSGNGLGDISCHPTGTRDSPAAQIKLTVSSDDLVALTDGKLGLAGAWGSGRLRVDASVFDILKLRSLL